MKFKVAICDLRTDRLRGDSRTQGGEDGIEADDLRGSRNARPQKALVRRAHDGNTPGHRG